MRRFATVSQVRPAPPRCSWVSTLFGIVTLCSLAALTPVTARSQSADYQRLRNQLVDDVLVPGGIRDERVLESIRKTPRHELVRPDDRKQAYYDKALPIGEKQTISSPFIVAYMTESLATQPEHKVLEIGTGSGYQAAVLSPLVKEVYSIEIVPELGNKAARDLKRLGYTNVHVKVGDGFLGWPEHAPFDRIIVTCSPEKIPQPLVDQLVEDGLVVVPVGERYQQMLYLMRKKNGKMEREALRPTLFVPMTGKAEDNREVQPDRKHPRVVNGGFEAKPESDKGFISGWYYEQQAERVEGNAPEGRYYLKFRNSDPGRPAHILQGFGIDARAVPELTLTAKVRFQQVAAGRDTDEVPRMALTFYDVDRKELGTWWIGPFRGTKDWHTVSEKFRVPPKAREAILRLGMFGAVGEVDFDDLRFQLPSSKP